jgi:hypothetical protein
VRHRAALHRLERRVPVVVCGEGAIDCEKARSAGVLRRAMKSNAQLTFDGTHRLLTATCQLRVPVCVCMWEVRGSVG